MTPGVGAALLLAACGPEDGVAPAADRRDLDAAQARVSAECPGDEERFARDMELAHGGDIAAIDCMILNLRAQALLADHSEALGRFDGVEDYVPGELRDALRRDELAYLYVRWRLTGEREGEVEALAETLPKAAIERALYLDAFDPALLPRVETDACGRVADSDPRHAIIMLGGGERDPAECPPGTREE